MAPDILQPRKDAPTVTAGGELFQPRKDEPTVTAEGEVLQPRKDAPTVTAEGELLQPRIDGLIVRRAHGIEDKRGEIVEIYRPSWGLIPDPLVYVYQATLRPGAIKGWVCHRLQEDRLFTINGSLRWAFYDDREESPTRGMLNVMTFSERNRALVIIPRGVYHAVENVGTELATFINLPTRPYDHGDPDKYRLPIKNDLIPFDFDDGRGW